MMVAFRYDNDAVGALYYSREIPSLFRGLRWSKLFGREGVITFESNGAVRRRARQRPAAADLPGLPRHPRLPGDVSRLRRGRSASGAQPEMSLERAMEDQRLMEQVYARGRAAPRDRTATTSSSSAAAPAAGRWRRRCRRDRRAHPRSSSAATSCRRKRRTGIRRRSGSTCATSRRSAGSTSAGSEFRPYTHYNVGGNTKFWGSVLYRLRREDFQAVEHRDGVSPAWPIDYDTLAPYYDRAERLYHVRGQHGVDPTEPPRGPYPYQPVPHAPAMAAIVEQLRAQGLHPSPLPLGLLRPGEADGCILCNTCNSFACRIHAKSEADVCAVRPAMRHGRTSRCGPTRCARRLITDAPRPQARGRRGRARTARRCASRRRCSSCRAAPSTRRRCCCARRATAIPTGLANSSGLVGRRYMAHLATMMQGFHPFRPNATVFQKTVAINDFYLARPALALSARPDPVAGAHARRDGADRRIRGSRCGPTSAWVSRGVDWLVMSEDLPRLDNRVTVERDGRIRLRLPAEQPAAAPRAGRGDQAHPAPARLLAGGEALARQQEHHAPVRHAGVRHRSARTRCSIRSAAPTTSTISSSSTPRSSPRRPPSTRG